MGGPRGPYRTKQTPIERFMEKIAISETLFWKGTPCWIWKGQLSPLGYGRFWANGRKGFAHRFSYQHHIRTIPKGLELDHLCRNPACSNPQHLEPVTHAVNIGRGATSQRNRERAAVQTHCANGHILSADNVYLRLGKWRVCKICSRRRTREWAKAHINLDRNKPGENVARIQTAKTHCAKGHPYAGENLTVLIQKNGAKWRQCNECSRIKARAWRLRNPHAKYPKNLKALA